MTGLRLLRLLPILGLSMFLFACAPKLQPLGPPVTEPSYGGDQLLMDDGVALPLRHWPAQGQTKAVVLALHLGQRVTHCAQEILVGGDDRAVEVEFDDGLRFVQSSKLRRCVIRIAIPAKHCARPPSLRS